LKTEGEGKNKKKSR